MKEKLTSSEALGRALSVVRTGRGMTQKGLASAAKLDASYLCLMENGKRNPSMRTLNVLVKALEISPARLMELTAAFLADRWERS